MWYLYLDESGDLGFDFKNKHPSKYFTITILCFQEAQVNRELGYAVRRTLFRKLNQRSHRKCLIEELKGAHTTLDIKKYLYRQIQHIDFKIYAVTLDKQKTMRYARDNKAWLYNYVARLVLDQIPLENVDRKGIKFIIDKSKGRLEIARFNDYVRQHLHSRLNPDIPLFIAHENSKLQSGLQAVDMFCSGIFQKYEHNKTDWLNVFASKVSQEQLYQG
ncbi:hypothetical protein NO1_0041 [Candidatus Termititenax aidoneus]|uniref:DUF3800 domain-containing protein n=1 Tax=Termititenax aidoneus TaxID=2218524 RepID=A0A388T8M3_TERA1|nr:hypothetical protein NO1_0041 [Candidatus Termititenax aidoneus]